MQHGNLEIIIHGLGTKGDVHPLIGIGKKFLRRGIKVTILTNDRFKALCEDSGLHFYSIGTLDEYKRGNKPKAWLANVIPETMWVEYHLPAFSRAFNYVKTRYVDNKNLLIISASRMDGARAAADVLNIPSVYLVLSPNLVFSAIAPPAPDCWIYPRWMPRWMRRLCLIWRNRRNHKNYVNPIFDGIRRKVGAMATINLKNEILQLGLFPEWYAMRARDWPKNLTNVGFPLFDAQHDEERTQLDAHISQYGAPILFTMGTGVEVVDEVYEVAVVVCQRLNSPVVFVGGKPERSSILLAKFLHINYVDFSYLLPKCSAVVHHGGMGTLSQAIRAGVPQLIRPIKFDQPDNALRIDRLGLGTFLLPTEFTLTRVEQVLREMLTNKQLYPNIQAYSADLARSNALEKAVSLILQRVTGIKV